MLQLRDFVANLRISERNAKDFSSCTMIVAKAGDGTLQDSSDAETFSLCSFAQQRFVVAGDAAHEVYRQVAATIGHDVMTKELAKVFHHQAAQFAVIEVLPNI